MQSIALLITYFTCFRFRADMTLWHLTTTWYFGKCQWFHTISWRFFF